MLQSENLTVYEYSEKDSTKKENFSLSNCNVYDNFCIMNYVVNNSLSKYIVFELNSKYNSRTVKVIATIMPPVIEYHFLKNGGKYYIGDVDFKELLLHLASKGNALLVFSTKQKLSKMKSMKKRRN